MSISSLSFLVRCLLIGVAVIGGGFEIKEIKMPRVGILVRLLSTGVGLGFILLGIGLWELDRQGALSGASALLEGQAAVAPASPSSTSERSDAEPSALPVTDSGPALENAAQPLAFGGFTGSNTLRWNVQGVEIVATTYMNGSSGMIRIFFMGADGQQYSVDEDLELRQGEGQFWYAGSNPRYAGTQTAFPDYKPDWFTLVQLADGSWTYAQACDPDGCNHVTVEAAG